MTGPRTPSLLRRAAAIAAALGALAPAGCANSPDDALFVALAGEAPGARTPYIDVEGATRLARPAPRMAGRRFRPAVTPEGAATGETARVRRAYERVRQAISDRDDELRLRARSMAQLGGAYRGAVGALRVEPGDPLPADDERFRGRLQTARDALGDLEGDTVKMAATLRQLERNLTTAEAVAAEARSLAVDTPEAGTDRGVRPALISASQATLDTGRQMAAAARNDLGRMIEYISGQRETLRRLEAQVRAAEGPSRLDQVRRTETVVDLLP